MYSGVRALVRDHEERKEVWVGLQDLYRGLFDWREWRERRSGCAPGMAAMARPSPARPAYGRISPSSPALVLLVSVPRNMRQAYRLLHR
jgi:hypothetical protein